MTKNNLKVVKSTKDQELDNKEKNKALDAAISQITDNFGNATTGTTSSTALLIDQTAPSSSTIINFSIVLLLVSTAASSLRSTVMFGVLVPLDTSRPVPTV